MAYSTLKDQTHGLALKLSSSEKSLQATYNQMVPLRQELLEAMASQASIQIELTVVRVKLVIAREEAQHFQAKFEALKDSFREFQDFFGGSATLIKIVETRNFLSCQTCISSTSREEFRWILVFPSISS